MRKSIVAVGAACLTVTGEGAAQAASGPGPAAGGTSCTTGQFSVRNGQVVDPGGSVFVAHGVNNAEPGNADKLLADFPGINFVRVPVYDLSQGSTSRFDDFVSTLTA